MIPTVYTHHVYIAPSRVPIWGSQDPKLGVQIGVQMEVKPRLKRGHFRGPNRGQNGVILGGPKTPKIYPFYRVDPYSWILTIYVKSVTFGNNC